MSDIENEAKPILEPMMLGQVQTVTLSPEDQATLSRWAFKTTLVAEFALRGLLTIPYRWYTDFYQRRLLPDVGCVIWMTAYYGTRYATQGYKGTFQIASHSPLPNPESSERPLTDAEAFLTTLAVFRTVFQTLGYFGGNWFPTKDGSVENSAFLIRLWPSTGTPASWPKNLIALNDRAILAFSKRRDFL